MWDVVKFVLDRYGTAIIPTMVLIGLGIMYISPPDNKEFQDRYLARLEKVESQYDSLRDENFRLKEEITKLKTRIVTLQTIQGSLPWPAWTKDLNGIVITANRAYEEAYLIPRGYTLYDYIGRTDHDVWPEDIAKRFVENDKQVIESSQFRVFEEEVEYPLGGKRQKAKYIKWPRYIGDTVVGVSGMLIPEVDLN